ncbi:MAG: ATP-dependent RecD-like DNA helicase [Azospirillaceae bacterium]|nr:ATP-dependent RecD-like DNA helicase [Azospirillaceae bacterium]
MPEFMSYVGNHPGVSFIDVPLGAATDRIAGLVAELGGTAAAQVVGVVKRGPAGVRTLNALFHERLGNVATFGGFAAGEPVMWTRNDRDLDLRNGSLGRVTAIDGALSITWDDGRSMELGADMLRHLEHAYAVTCHKAQGSQSRRIVVPVFASRLLDRSLLYTAITRAQEQVVLVGDRRAMAEAIRLPPAAARRQTMMSEMLVSAFSS